MRVEKNGALILSERVRYEKLIREAIPFHIRGLIADGDPVPEPTVAPASPAVAPDAPEAAGAALPGVPWVVLNTTV